MARAPAANRFHLNALRSTSSRASTAKGKKKPAAGAEWTAEDRAAAQLQGWDVFDIVDNTTAKLFMEIQEYGPRFEHGGFARAFVIDQIKAGDVLALKATRLVFRSKVGAQARTKK